MSKDPKSKEFNRQDRHLVGFLVKVLLLLLGALEALLLVYHEDYHPVH